MRLDLSPNEYLQTSREVYETAMSYQAQRRQGTEQARNDVDRKKKQDEKTAKSHADLKARAGG